MAILKPIDVDGSGIEVGYWRIVRAAFDFDLGDHTVTLAGYASGAARADGKQPVASAYRSVTFQSDDALDRKALYAAAMADEQFKDGVSDEAKPEKKAKS
jgi:hypothetical protein